MEIFNCKSLCVRAGALLKFLTPPIQQIYISDLQLPKDKQNPIFHHFYDTLVRGAELLKKCENISTFNLPLNYRYASQILKLEKDINGFLALLPAHILLGTRLLLPQLQKNYPHEAAPDISRGLNDFVFKQASMLTTDPSENTMMLQQMVLDNLSDSTQILGDSGSYRHDSGYGKSQILVGLEKSIGDLKEILFNDEMSVVGVHCMGGGGKTTLALALSNDSHILDYFGNNVFFITVSQSPNLKSILETIWEKKTGKKKKPEFQNVEDARLNLKVQLLKQLEPTLLILDDVWDRASLENLLFEGPGYKTLVTTRNSSVIPKNPSTELYLLPLLGQENALSLFCFWAFGQTSIPCTADENLVKEVQAECKGLPLALKVIGSSLHGEAPVVWDIAKNKLSKREPISYYHKEGLLKCLETSIDMLDDVVRECFLDLGSFPEDTRICADALLDIWVYARNLGWQDAFVILLELASRNLLNLTSNTGSGAAIFHGSVSELYFSQHDAMRDVALYLGCQGDFVHRKRLLMPRKELNLPRSWAFSDAQFDAQIVAIHTGPMGEKQWYEMNFPEAEALILLFAASEYYLPPFLKSMKKLKYLMVYNYGTKRATVKGLEAISSLTKLKSVRLEKVIAPAVLKQSKALENLEKLSLSLCEGFKNTSTFNNSKLHDFNMDHCTDLEELPSNICYMPSAQMWSITNCHLVQKLPYDIGNLSSLRVLRLSSLPGLKELPPSIGNLGWLEYLDISECVGLKELPEEIGQLKKLSELDMRECCGLKRVPRTVCGLTSLKHVICDEKIGKQWLKAKGIAIPELRVDIVEVHFTLDWLDD